MSEPSEPASPRTTVRRGTNRAEYSPEVMRAILDAGVIAHVGVQTDEGPLVLPMAYGRTDDELLLHGAVANSLLRAGEGVDICATVTIVDGLVVARTPFHNSMNYRSVVVRGTAHKIEDAQDKLDALRIITVHVANVWDHGRPPSEIDVTKTLVLRMSLDEMSAKVRATDPVDEPDDMTGPWWAGLVPLNHAWGEPKPADDLAPGIAIPAAVAALGGTTAHR